MPRKEGVRLQILSGWKEIASYLGMGVRTVQRYERELGLPIHRPAGHSRGAVIGVKAEIDGWINTTPTQTDSTQKPMLAGRTNRLGANFLLIDSEIALTFSGIAFQTSKSEKKRHMTQTPRKAYDTIMRLRKNLDLSEAERSKLDANLLRLKDELQRLGESF